MKRFVAISLLLLLLIGRAADCGSFKLSNGVAGILQVNGAGQFDFAVSSDGKFAVFRTGAGLYSTPLDGGSAQLLTGSPGSVSSFAISPHGARVAYVRSDVLYSVPITGGAIHNVSGQIFPAGQQRLPEFQIAPNSESAVFKAFQSGVQGRTEMYSAALDHGMATQISTPPLSGQVILNANRQPFRISSDSARVVYVEKPGISDSPLPDLLKSVPLGGGPVTTLYSTMGIDEGIFNNSVQLTSDGQFAVYGIGYSSLTSDFWKVPIAGGDPALLTAPVANGSIFASSYLISPDGSRIAYIGRQELPDIDELFTASLEGGMPLRINDRELGAAKVELIRMSPDGQRILMYAAPGLGETGRFFSVPTQGGENVTLTPPLYPLGEYEISPDSEYLIFTHYDDSAQVGRLYSVPMEGGEIVDLTGPMVQFGQVREFSITPDGKSVVFLKNPENFDVAEIFQVPIRGGLAEKLNSPLLPGTSIDQTEFAHLDFTADQKYVVYASAARELYAAELIAFQVPEPSSLLMAVLGSFTCLFNNWRFRT